MKVLLPCVRVRRREKVVRRKKSGTEKRKSGAEKRICTLGPPYQASVLWPHKRGGYFMRGGVYRGTTPGGPLRYKDALICVFGI